MRLPTLVQQLVNDFCAQTGNNGCHAGSLTDLLFDIDPVEADAFVMRPDIQWDTVLRPGPVPVVD